MIPNSLPDTNKENLINPFMFINKENLINPFMFINRENLINPFMFINRENLINPFMFINRENIINPFMFTDDNKNIDNIEKSQLEEAKKEVTNEKKLLEERSLDQKKDLNKKSLNEIERSIKKSNHDKLNDNIVKEHLKSIDNMKPSKIDCNYLAEQLVHQLNFMYYRGALYFYESPIYKRLNEHEGKTLIKYTLGKECSRNLKDSDLKEILRQIETTPEIQRKEGSLNTYPHLICFKNGVYSLKDKTLYKPDPRYNFFSFVDVNYNPINIGNGFYFEKYLNKCSGGNPEIKELICQIIGYIISNYMVAKKIFFIVGKPDSGKSTFGEFMESLLGKENCCNIALQDLSKRFNSADLFGKKLCLNMDLPDTPIKDTGIIKQLTGNDSVKGERKYEHSFSFKNEAKLLYGANNLPKIHRSENADAFYRRLIIIPFNESIPYNEQDIYLKEKLISESNYIIHKCLKALDKLVLNNFKFINCQESNYIKQQYVASNNNVISFLKERCEVDKNSRIYTRDFYSYYVQYCKITGYKDTEIYTLKKFSNIVSNTLNIKQSKYRDGDENLNGFIGVSVNKPVQERREYNIKDFY